MTENIFNETLKHEPALSDFSEKNKDKFDEQLRRKL